jgi:hypothetical protein
LTKTVFDQITQHQPQTIITQLFERANATFFGAKPPSYIPYIYDTTAFAFIRSLPPTFEIFGWISTPLSIGITGSRSRTFLIQIRRLASYRIQKLFSA